MAQRKARPSISTRVQQRVKALRAERGMTQEQLCEVAGISLDAVSRIEGGSRVPTLETTEKLAVALGVSFAQLIDDDGAVFPPAFPARVLSVAHMLARADTRVQLAAERLLKILIEVSAERS